MAPKAMKDMKAATKDMKAATKDMKAATKAAMKATKAKKDMKAAMKATKDMKATKAKTFPKIQTYQKTWFTRCLGKYYNWRLTNLSQALQYKQWGLPYLPRASPPMAFLDCRQARPPRVSPNYN
jgi:hypothetical protein